MYSFRAGALARLCTVASLCFSPAAWAILTIDDIRWPESGAFPAYPEALSAAATGRRFHAFVDAGAYRDNNLFRLPSGAGPSSETFTRLGVGLRGDLPFSRQRLRLEAQINDNRYRNFTQLDNVSGRGSATLDWEAGTNLSGNLGAYTERALSGFGQIQAVVRDMVTQDRAFGNAAFRITPDWRVRAGLNTFQYKHSDSTRTGLNTNQADLILGGDYVTPLQNSIGAQVRYSRGDFPDLVVVGAPSVNGHYKEVEPSAVLHYNIGGKSSVDARLGYTRRTHEQLTARDFRGSTGNLAFHWSPTPKTLLDLGLFKETRPYVTSSIGSVLTSIDTTSAYVVAQGITFSPQWALTDQVVLQAQFIDERDNYRGDPNNALLGTPEREDKFRAASGSVGWSPLRPLLLSVSLERGRRTSNINVRGFDYNALSLNARYTFF